MLVYTLFAVQRLFRRSPCFLSNIISARFLLSDFCDSVSYWFSAQGISVTKINSSTYTPDMQCVANESPVARSKIWRDRSVKPTKTAFSLVFVVNLAKGSDSAK